MIDISKNGWLNDGMLNNMWGIEWYMKSWAIYGDMNDIKDPGEIVEKKTLLKGKNYRVNNSSVNYKSVIFLLFNIFFNEDILCSATCQNQK